MTTFYDLVTATCVLVALGAFFGLGASTDLGDEPRFAVLIGVGVILPTIVTNLYSS